MKYDAAWVAAMFLAEWHGAGPPEPFNWHEYRQKGNLERVVRIMRDERIGWNIYPSEVQ
jgi:hypothetical protein